MWGIRLGIAFGMLLVLFSSAMGAKAQSEYRALLYDSANGIIRELDAAGAVVDSVQLPMPSGYGVYSFNAAFDRAYKYVAYIVSDPPGTRFQLMVFGYQDERTYVAHSVEGEIYASLFLHPSQDYHIFNEYGLVVFAYNLVSDGIFTDRWKIDVFDVNNGMLYASLNSEQFSYPLSSDQVVPLPYILENQSLTFGIPHMFDAPDHWSDAVYVWKFAEGEITRAPYDLSPKYASAWGSTISLWQSPNMEPTRAWFPNTLIHQEQNDAPTLFYVEPNLNFTDVYFVEDRFHVLARGVTQAEAERWMFIDWHGEVVMLFPSGFHADAVQSTEDGFVYTVNDTRRQISSLYHLNTISREFNLTLIAGDVPGHLVGLRQGLSLSPRQTTTVQPLFSVGDRVMITQAGNQLRMRITPGGEVQRQFNAGAVVTIVGGPTEFTRTAWWQVRDKNGVVGWISQGNDEVSYLTLAQ